MASRFQNSAHEARHLLLLRLVRPWRQQVHSVQCWILRVRGTEMGLSRSVWGNYTVRCTLSVNSRESDLFLPKGFRYASFRPWLVGGKNCPWDSLP